MILTFMSEGMRMLNDAYSVGQACDMSVHLYFVFDVTQLLSAVLGLHVVHYLIDVAAMMICGWIYRATTNAQQSSENIRHKESVTKGRGLVCLISIHSGRCFLQAMTSPNRLSDSKSSSHHTTACFEFLLGEVGNPC